MLTYMTVYKLYNLSNEFNNFHTTDVLRTRFLCRQSATCPPPSIVIVNWQNREGKQQNQPVMQVKKLYEYNLHVCVLDV